MKAILKIKNFKAALPHDFLAAKSVQFIGVPIVRRGIVIGMSEPHLINAANFVFPTFDMLGKFNLPSFCIKDSEILINGSYNRFLLIRWFQKLYYLIFPIKVILTYISSEDKIPDGEYILSIKGENATTL